MIARMPEPPASDLIHVLNEDASPEDELVWTMWCGHQCMVFDDGECVPYTDFYTEDWAHRSNCEPCKRAISHAQIYANDNIPIRQSAPVDSR